MLGPSSARSTASRRPASARSSPSARADIVLLRAPSIADGRRRGPVRSKEEALLREGRRIAFGTDGVRGVANETLMPEDALRLGLAVARLFGGPILIGRDTRLSGGMLSSSLASGAASGGANVVDVGVLP